MKHLIPFLEFHNYLLQFHLLPIRDWNDDTDSASAVTLEIAISLTPY